MYVYSRVLGGFSVVERGVGVHQAEVSDPDVESHGVVDAEEERARRPQPPERSEIQAPRPRRLHRDQERTPFTFTDSVLRKAKSKWWLKSTHGVLRVDDEKLVSNISRSEGVRLEEPSGERKVF